VVKISTLGLLGRGAFLASLLSLAACAQMVTPTPAQVTNNAIAVQEGRAHIFSLSPQVKPAELVPAQRALAAARAADARGDYLYADRQTQLAKLLLDNVQARLDGAPGRAEEQQLKRQIREEQQRVAELQQKVAATRKQLGDTTP
jgi:hypothetical protein